MLEFVGDWEFGKNDAGQLRIEADVSTPTDDRTLGFAIPVGAPLVELIESVVEAEKDALNRGWKFLVKRVLHPETQEPADRLPDNVIPFKKRTN